MRSPGTERIEVVLRSAGPPCLGLSCVRDDGSGRKQCGHGSLAGKGCVPLASVVPAFRAQRFHGPGSCLICDVNNMKLYIFHKFFKLWRIF